MFNFAGPIELSTGDALLILFFGLSIVIFIATISFLLIRASVSSYIQRKKNNRSTIIHKSIFSLLMLILCFLIIRDGSYWLDFVVRQRLPW